MSYGVRFVGKDPDGIAKAISVNDDGVLLVELLGSLLVGEVAENPTANTILGRMKSLESKIDTLNVAIDSILAKIIDSPATEAKQTALEALVGTLTDTAVNDPTASGTIIALLKGLITQMQGDGASGKSMPVQLSGSRVVKEIVYNSSVRDTNTFFINVDASAYIDFNIIVRNTLDAPIGLSGYLGAGAVFYVWDGEKFVTTSSIEAVLNTGGHFALSDHPAFSFIKDKGITNFAIRAKCSSAPTTGLLIVEIHGRVV